MTPCYRAGSESQCATGGGLCAGEVARDGNIGFTGGTSLGVKKKNLLVLSILSFAADGRDSREW